MVEELFHGVTFSPLIINSDDRGCLAEIYRDEWHNGTKPCQWNMSKSKANVLRGVHVHYKHTDHMVVLVGRLSIGLYDLRPNSPTYKMATLLEVDSKLLSALRIPVGVMHGFYAHESTMYICGVDSYYEPQDELGCHWADPALGIPWPCQHPELSERDKKAASLGEVQAQFIALNRGLR
jgi:dTDP-4-dehydrorhamnose 3,5-epimerase